MRRNRMRHYLRGNEIVQRAILAMAAGVADHVWSLEEIAALLD